MAAGTSTNLIGAFTNQFEKLIDKQPQIEKLKNAFALYTSQLHK